MRSALLLAAAAGIASANPVATASPSAQNGIDLSVFDVGNPVLHNPKVNTDL